VSTTKRDYFDTILLALSHEYMCLVRILRTPPVTHPLDIQEDQGNCTGYCSSPHFNLLPDDSVGVDVNSMLYPLVMIIPPGKEPQKQEALRGGALGPIHCPVRSTRLPAVRGHQSRESWHENLRNNAEIWYTLAFIVVTLEVLRSAFDVMIVALTVNLAIQSLI
jgi:hypothetical protein